MDGRSRWLTTPGWVESVCVLQHDAVWTTRHILLLLSQHMRTWRHMHAARSVPRALGLPAAGMWFCNSACHVHSALLQGQVEVVVEILS